MKTSRQSLTSAIAVTLVAASLLVADTTAQGRSGSLPISRIASVGFTVSDMDRSITFYRNVLTFKPVSDVEVDGPEYDRLWGVFGVRA